MTLDEFRKKAEEDPDWTPGVDAIQEAMELLYPLQDPQNYSADVNRRAAFGGDLYLDGVSIYHSRKGYKHLVTYGMTELYINEEMFETAQNGMGYEMTMKVKEETFEKCMWAVNILNVLARFTYTQGQFFSPGQFINLAGPITFDGKKTKITALLTVEDTELQPTYSVYGETTFLQLVGITDEEAKVLQENPERTEELIQLIREDNPDMVTDLTRTESYLKP